jgi:tripartite-type tricarboxylate transporter receptor subunit TctC
VPEARVALLSDALARAINDPGVRETLAAQGIEPVHSNPKEYGAILVRELDKWSKLIEEAKIKL